MKELIEKEIWIRWLFAQNALRHTMINVWVKLECLTVLVKFVNNQKNQA